MTKRVSKLRKRMINTNPSLSIERARIFTEICKENEDVPIIIRRAKAFKQLCKRKEIRILDGELLVGDASEEWRQGMMDPASCVEFIYEEAETISQRPQDPFTFSDDKKEIFMDEIWPYWKDKSVHARWKKEVPKDIQQMFDASLFSTSKIAGGPGEISFDFPRLLTVGITGLRSKIEEELQNLSLEEPNDISKRDFLRAGLLVCDGFEILAERYAALARKKAKSVEDMQRKKELEKIAEVCSRVPMQPATTFWEALQSIWFFLMGVWMESNAPSYSLGKMDQYLNPYYQEDKKTGKITKKEALELLELFNLKIATRIRLLSKEDVKHFSGYMSFQTVVVGGETSEGRDGVNELSYMLLESKKDLRLNQPSLKVILSRKNPYKFWLEVAKLIREGTGFPPVYNHEVGKQMVMDKGIPLEEAQDWVPHGCVEAVLPGKLAQITDIGHYNAPAAIEFVFTNGEKRTGSKAGQQLGLQTGDLSKFETFDQFKAAVKQQLRYLIGKLQVHGLVLTKAYRELYPLPVESLLIDGCIENGADRTEGGAKYNAGYAHILTGVADLADSLVAIKKLVFEQEVVTLEVLNEALNNNFQGYETLYSKLIDAPKYGNDISEVDNLARELTDYCSKIAKSFKDINGNRTCHGLFPVTSHVPMGHTLGALPSGRKAGKPLGDGVSPAQGMDQHGPTAVMKSVTRLNHATHNTGTLLNQKFNSDALATDARLKNFINLIKTYFDLGGYHVQFNVIDAETLRDAQAHPKEYQDLLVRVAGYSAYFVELNPDVQEEIITRTAHSRSV